MMLFLGGGVHGAVDAVWSGAVSSNFEAPGNWSVFPADDTTNHVAVFTGVPGTNQPQLTQSRSVAGLRFGGATVGWTLGGDVAGRVLTVGTNGIAGSGSGTGTNVVAVDLFVRGTQAWQTATGGTLWVAGSLSATSGVSVVMSNSPATGTVLLSPAAGRAVSIFATNIGASLFQVRNGGTLLLGGDGVATPATGSTNDLVNLSTNSTFAAWTITGTGRVRVNSGVWNTTDLGRNDSVNGFSGTLEVAGGTLALTGARFLSTGTVRVVGGTLRCTASNAVFVNGGRFSPGALGTAGAAVVEVSGGLLDLARANGGNSIGASASTRFLHTGGTVQNALITGGGTNSGSVTTFTIGPGGVTSNNQTAYTLSGSGTFLSAGMVQGQAATTGTNTMNNFNFNGGTLAVASFNATNLGYASDSGLAGGGPSTNPVANCVGKGTLYNNGGSLAPGGPGTAGLTVIAGEYAVNSGELAIDLGGTNPATVFRGTGHDVVSVTGSAALGGSLRVSHLGGFVPSNSQVFTVLTASNVTGAFTNLVSGSRLPDDGGEGWYLVTLTSNAVTLSDFELLTSPVITTNPGSASVQAGLSLTLTAAAASPVPMTWQWRRNGTNLPGAVSSSLTLFPVRTNDAGAYDVVVSNLHGAATSTVATVTVTLFSPGAIGQRNPAYTTNGLGSPGRVPAVGVHPRLYFNTEDLPAIRARLTNTAVGREAALMIGHYARILRLGRSAGYDTLPATNKTMPDGTARISNIGLYDQSLYFTNLVAGQTNLVAGLCTTNSSGGTLANVLASSMALEAFDCLVNEGQPGVAQRATNVATALATWASWVNTTPYAFYPGTNAAFSWRFGGHHAAIAYDLVHNNLSPAQRDTVRTALASMLEGHIEEGYYGVDVPPEAAVSNWALIFSFRLVVACAIEGEINLPAHGLSSEAAAEYYAGAMDAIHKYLTYGYWTNGEPYEGMGKNALYGVHPLMFARRDHNFFAHPHVQQYVRNWLPAIVQPYGYSFTLYDLLGGSGFDPERGRMFVEGSDYVAIKWMFPNDNAADFLWRNYVLTEYKTNGQWQTFLDLRDGKFVTRHAYRNILLPAAIFASDVASTNSWQAQNAAVLGKLDFFSRDGATLVSRSGFDTNAMQMIVHIRQDFGGHTFADRNAFTVSALGRVFINYNSGSSDSGLESNMYHTVVHVDDTAMKVTLNEGQKRRIPAKLAAWSFQNTNLAFVTGDATYAYSWEWDWRDYATNGNPTILSGFTRESNTFNRFRRSDNLIPEAHANVPFLSFPDWLNPGKLEGMQAKAFNPMRQVYRTVGLVRGTRPYGLVVDDVRKDNTARNYKWIASIAEDLTLLTGGSLPPGCDPATDVVLQEPGGTGDRRLLVRVLRADGTPTFTATNWASGSTLAYTQILTNKTETWHRLVVERASVVEPNFRLLLFPFRSGDTLPVTTWTNGFTNLVVQVGGQTDLYTFYPRTQTVAGQTVTLTEFVLSRNGTNLMDYRNQIEPMGIRTPTGTPDAVPSAPAPLGAAAVSDTQVRLDWMDYGTNETAFLIERSAPGASNWIPVVSSLASNTTLYVDGSVFPTNGYDYRVRSVHPSGLSAYATASATTPAPIGDGIPGWWRYQEFGNGVSVIPGVSGTNDNPDGDEFDNLAEFYLGTQPRNPASTLRGEPRMSGSDILVGFPSVAGKRYRVVAKSDLVSTGWPLTVATNIAGTGGWVEIIDAGALNSTQRFYRVTLEP